MASSWTVIANRSSIAFTQFVLDFGDLSLSPSDLAGHLLLNEFDAAEILPVGKGEDISPVLVQVLGHFGDPKISDGSGYTCGHRLSKFEENAFLLSFVTNKFNSGH